VKQEEEEIPSEESESKREDTEYRIEVPDTKSDDFGKAIRLEQTGWQSQSFLAIPQSLQELCFVAQAWVSEYIYFKNSMLNSLNVIHLVNDACEFAQDREKYYQKRTKACNLLVSYSQ